jgi:hypothetical protein
MYLHLEQILACRPHITVFLGYGKYILLISLKINEVLRCEEAYGWKEGGRFFKGSSRVKRLISRAAVCCGSKCLIISNGYCNLFMDINKWCIIAEGTFARSGIGIDMVGIVASTFLTRQAVQNLEDTSRRHRERAGEIEREKKRREERPQRDAESSSKKTKGSMLPSDWKPEPVKKITPETLKRPTTWPQKNDLRHVGPDATAFEKGIALRMELESKDCKTSRCLKLIADGADLDAKFIDDSNGILALAEYGRSGSGYPTVVAAILEAQSKKADINTEISETKPGTSSPSHLKLPKSFPAP